MSLKRILSEAFSGGRTAPPRGTVGSLVDELKRLAGSRRAAGRAAGIGESTLRRWEKGARPKDATGALRRLASGIRSLWRTDPGPTVTVRITNPGKGPNTRTVGVDAGAVERAGDAWQRGDLTGMVREFVAGVEHGWYRERLFRPQPGDTDPEYDDDDLAGEGEAVDDESSEPLVGGVSW